MAASDKKNSRYHQISDNEDLDAIMKRAKASAELNAHHTKQKLMHAKHVRSAKYSNKSFPRVLDDPEPPENLPAGYDPDVESLGDGSAPSEIAMNRGGFPAVVSKILDRVGYKAARKMEAMIDDPAFDKLPMVQRMRILSEMLDRAYGKSSTSSSKDNSELDLEATNQILRALASNLPEMKAKKEGSKSKDGHPTVVDGEFSRLN